MAEETYSEILLRSVAGQLQLLNMQMAARDMFQRGYFSLGEAEKRAVEQTVWAGSAPPTSWASRDGLLKQLGRESNPLQQDFGFPIVKPNPEEPA